MAEFVDGKFTDSTVTLDGHEYLRCKFVRCTVLVRAFEPRG
jgi:hypothetical protein